MLFGNNIKNLLPAPSTEEPHNGEKRSEPTPSIVYTAVTALFTKILTHLAFSTFPPDVQLQPLDVIGIDGLGPISPASDGHKYILIVVDYFTRYAWAQAFPAINGSVVSGMIAGILRTFGLAWSVYTDNATYFVQGVFPDFLTIRGVQQFPAPKTHPSSVGLLERYAQLIFYGIRKLVVSGGEILRWSKYLDQVVHSMNTRDVRVHGFTPAKLLFGYNPVRHHHDFTVRDHHADQDLQD